MSSGVLPEWYLLSSQRRKHYRTKNNWSILMKHPLCAQASAQVLWGLQSKKVMWLPWASQWQSWREHPPLALVHAVESTRPSCRYSDGPLVDQPIKVKQVDMLTSKTNCENEHALAWEGETRGHGALDVHTPLLPAEGVLKGQETQS